MSHFDDVSPLFWGEGPKSPVGCAIFGVVVAGAITWAVMADSASEKLCRDHGEVYVDSRDAYTLCQRPDGTVVKR